MFLAEFSWIILTSRIILFATTIWRWYVLFCEYSLSLGGNVRSQLRASSVPVSTNCDTTLPAIVVFFSSRDGHRQALCITVLLPLRCLMCPEVHNLRA